MVLRDQETDAPGRPFEMDDTPRVTSCLLRLRSTCFAGVCGCGLRCWLDLEVKETLVVPGTETRTPRGRTLWFVLIEDSSPRSRVSGFPR